MPANQEAGLGVSGIPYLVPTAVGRATKEIPLAKNKNAYEACRLVLKHSPHLTCDGICPFKHTAFCLAISKGTCSRAWGFLKPNRHLFRKLAPHLYLAELAPYWPLQILHNIGGC